MNETIQCSICDKPAKFFESEGSYTHQNCPDCGHYKVAHEVKGRLQNYDRDIKIKLRGWIREKNRASMTPIIDNYRITWIYDQQLPSVSKRADCFLLEALHGEDRLGAAFMTHGGRFKAATYSYKDEDIRYLRNMLEEQKFLEMDGRGECRMLPAGYVAAEKLIKNPTNSKNAFVAMSFDKDMDLAFKKGFQPGIENASYEAIRIDQVEHNNKIDDEIIVKINSSLFVVADFTGHKGGVYFEAGYAMGMGLPIIWTCRKDHMKGLHFDVRQYNCIVWEDHDKLANDLKLRIQATVSMGIQK